MGITATAATPDMMKYDSKCADLSLWAKKEVSRLGRKLNAEPTVRARAHAPCNTPKRVDLFLSEVESVSIGKNDGLAIAAPKPPAKPTPPIMLATVSKDESRVSPKIA